MSEILNFMHKNLAIFLNLVILALSLVVWITARHSPSVICYISVFSSSWLEWWGEPSHFPSYFQPDASSSRARAAHIWRLARVCRTTAPL